MNLNRLRLKRMLVADSNISLLTDNKSNNSGYNVMHSNMYEATDLCSKNHTNKHRESQVDVAFQFTALAT